MHVTWCSSLLSPPLFKEGIVIASARLSVCLSVRRSVCYALSSLTIGRNPTKFGVQDFHMCGVCDSTFFGHPTGAPRKVQRSTLIFEKSISKILYQTLCLFSQVKEMGFSLCRLGHTPAGWTWGCLGVNFLFFFSKHGRAAYQTKGDGEQNRIQVKCHPMVKLVTLR